MHNVIIRNGYDDETYFVAISAEQLELLNWLRDNNFLSVDVSFESFNGFKSIKELKELMELT